jgi:hypothetical protein
MLKLAFALSIMLSALFGGVGRPSPPAASDGYGFITAEVVVGRESKIPHTFQVPIAKASERKFVDDKFDGAGWSWVESCPPDTGCSGHIIVIADRVTDDSSKIMVTLKYDDRRRCNDQKERSVARGETVEFKMKCGAKVKAYYVPQQKAAN